MAVEPALHGDEMNGRRRAGNQGLGRVPLTDEDREFTKAVGQRIRERRQELGYKGPTDLARNYMDDEEVKNFAAQLSAIERGMYTPRYLLLVRIARMLEVSSSVLLGDHDEDAVWEAGYRAALEDAGVAISTLRKKRNTR